MNGMYVVENRITKMCLEMVNSITSAKEDIEGIATEKDITLLTAMNNLARAIDTMMSVLQDELLKDAEALLLSDEN